MRSSNSRGLIRDRECANMPAKIIDGKAVAQRIRSECAERVRLLAASSAVTPGLAVILVGDDPASRVYVNNKIKQTRQAGMLSIEHRLAADFSERALLALIAELNANPAVHGILV